MALPPASDAPSPPPERVRGAWPVFWIFLRLGLTSFGGPVAHLGYFHREFVVQRRWLSEVAYADLVALCQLLPGPASSQVGMALGLHRAGHAGALAAWAGFTLPSALALAALARGLAAHGAALPAGVLQGLKVVAVAVVAQAVWAMARRLCPDAPRLLLMLASAGLALALAPQGGQVVVLALAAGTGLLLGQAQDAPALAPPAGPAPAAGWVWLALFAALLPGLPVLAVLWPLPALQVVDAFYRAGALVFGGGHVVLPLLQAAVVPSGWIDNDTFLAGYGAAQAVPGPLFTFAAFLGGAMQHGPGGWWGAALGVLAVFAPGLLLVLGAWPLWQRLRHRPRLRAALAGVNAGVVGLLLAALYRPVWTSAVHDVQDFVLAAAALAALVLWRLPAWLVVLGSGAAGGLLAARS